MGNQLFADNASSILAANVNNTSDPVTVQLSTGDGNLLFPSISGSQFFIIAVESSSGAIEYMKVTARSGDNLTCTRAQEGTTKLAFTANLARVELRNTAGSMAGMYQKAGDTLSGPLNGGSQTATNLILGAGSSVQAATEIVNTPLRGATGISTNQIVVPTDGSRATAGGAKILCAGDPIPAFTIGQIMMWYGALANVPALWHACDGSTVTNSVGASIPVPDLRDKFVVGAGGSLSPTAGGTGGSTSLTVPSQTIAAGTTGATALTAADIPAHRHIVPYCEGDSVYGASPFAKTTAPNSQYGAAGGTDTDQGWFQTSDGTSTYDSPKLATSSGHTHTTPAITVPAQTLTVSRPPFVGLFYIMYVG